MRIKLQNRHVAVLVPFLRDMKLKGEQSRARSKFLNLAMGVYAALHDSELELLKEYAACDEDGSPVQNEDGGFTLKEASVKEYLKERDKMFGEVAEIEGGTYTAHLALMKQILADYTEDLDGEEAELYDALMDAFEEVKTDG